LWGRTLGGNWPPEPTSSYASIDFWCQLVARSVWQRKMPCHQSIRHPDVF